MEPQLSKIEALAEPGCYSVTLALHTGEERAVVARLRNKRVVLPAGAFTGWSPESDSWAATVAAVQAVHAARELARPRGRRLVDIDGGWDVSLGNVVPDKAGTPSCVTHGPLENTGDVLRCAECGAAARYAD